MTRELPLHDAIPRVLPDGWRIVQPWGDGNAYAHRNGLRALVSTAPYPDGREWMHISVSRKKWLPNWDDLKLVKETFAGETRVAYQVFPRDAEYVNIHEYCLHLWVPLTGEPPLPDFTRGGGTI